MYFTESVSGWRRNKVILPLVLRNSVPVHAQHDRDLRGNGTDLAAFWNGGGAGTCNSIEHIYF